MMRLSFLLLPLFCASSLLAGTPEGELEQWLLAKKKLGDVQVTLQMTRTLPTLKEPTVRAGQSPISTAVSTLTSRARPSPTRSRSAVPG
jgi:hypothetical protein